MTQYTKDTPESVQKMFGTIAKDYDRANAILSFKLHNRWNKALVHQVTAQQKVSKLLDICCGTGEIGFHFLRQCSEPCELFLLDFCQEMLTIAKQKAENIPEFDKHQLHYLEADAQKLPLPSNSIEAVTIAYGIRNVRDPQQCAEEVYRVLQPGGTIAILELTRPTNPVLRLGHNIYLKTFLPLIGKAATSNQQAYQYLCRSIQSFISPKELMNILSEVGFAQVSATPLYGGIATIVYAKKV